MSTAVVIGGGISGLSACHYLLKSAKYSKVLVLEASSRLGGWVHSVRHEDGTIFELGPRSIRIAGPSGFNTLCLLEELGLEKDILTVTKESPAAKNRFIYMNKKINALPNNPAGAFKTTPLLGQPLVLPILGEPFKQRGHGDDESVHDFVSRRLNSKELLAQKGLPVNEAMHNYVNKSLNSNFAENLINPVCRGIFAGNSHQLSMRSCFPDMFRWERDHGSLVKGMFKRPKVKHKKEPALASRVKDERWSVYSFKRGMQQLPNRLKEEASQRKEAELLRDTPCSPLQWKDGKFLVNINGDTVKADHVFSSIYSKDLTQLLPQAHMQLSSELVKIPAVSVVVVVVELADRVELPTPGFGHLLPSHEDGKMLGVIYDSCTFPQHDRPEKPSTRFTIMMGGAWYQQLESSVASMTEEALGTLAVDSLFTQLGIKSSVSKIHVSINKDAIPQYHVGHYKVLENISSYIQDHKLPLSLIGSSYKGVSVNDCINNARLAVEDVTGLDLQF